MQADFANRFVIEFECPFVTSVVTNGIAYVRFPFFDRVTIRLSGDRTVDVLKPDHATDEAKVRFNQSVLADFVISREMLKTGGVLR